LAGTQTIGEAGNYYTDACYSAVAGSSTPVWDFGGALAASDLSFRHYSGGIEVANMGAGAGTYNMSLEGNGQLVIAASCSATSNISIRGHFSITDNAGGAVTVTDDARFNVGQSMFIDASAMSNISSRVDSALASDLSNILSAAVQTNSRVILALSLISDVDSQLLLTHSLLSDVESQVDLLATSDYVSQIHSDLTSQIGGIAASVSASDISDIASAVEAILASVMSDTLSAAQEGSSRALVAQSLISDVDSQLLLTHSLLSDVESQVDLLVTSNYLSQVHSDLYSAVGAVAATVSPSDISDIASAVVDALASDFSDIQSQLSNAHSDLRSLMSTAGGAVTASDISDIASAVWATALATKLVQLNPSDLSDIRSAIAAGPAATVTASDISDIASAVEAILASVMSDTLSAAQEGSSRALVTQSLISDVDSQLLLTHSLLSDVESQVDLLATSNYLSQVHSDIVSAIGGIAASVSASDISDIASAVEAILASDLSDAISAAREGSSRALLNQSAISDVESQLDLTQSLLSDVESQVDLLATSDYLSAVHSDLASAIGAITVVLTPSDISDITSGILAGLAVTVFPTGAIDWDYNVTDSVTLLPISGVEVWVSTDNPAVNIIWKGTTDAFGDARDVLENVPALDAGTYYFWRQKSGYTFDNPDTEIVA